MQLPCVIIWVIIFLPGLLLNLVCLRLIQAFKFKDLNFNQEKIPRRFSNYRKIHVKMIFSKWNNAIITYIFFEKTVSYVFSVTYLTNKSYFDILFSQKYGQPWRREESLWNF